MAIPASGINADEASYDRRIEGIADHAVLIPVGLEILEKKKEKSRMWVRRNPWALDLKKNGYMCLLLLTKWVDVGGWVKNSPADLVAFVGQLSGSCTAANVSPRIPSSLRMNLRCFWMVSNINTRPFVDSYSHYAYVTLHYITLHYITLMLHYVTLHYITLHRIASHRIASHRIALHYITCTIAQCLQLHSSSRHKKATNYAGIIKC